jgi:hypothetical protein
MKMLVGIRITTIEDARFSVGGYVYIHHAEDFASCWMVLELQGEGTNIQKLRAPTQPQVQLRFGNLQLVNTSYRFCNKKTTKAQLTSL